jgi:hypothetical protein
LDISQVLTHKCSLKGSLIDIIIGGGGGDGPNSPTTAPQRYRLPQVLLGRDSFYFHSELTKINPADIGASTSNTNPSSDSSNPVATTSATYKNTIRETPASSSSKINTIALPDGFSLVFDSYVRYLYHGAYPSTDSAGPNMIPLRIQAWCFGFQIRLSTFQNHALEHIYKGVGAQFSLYPRLVGWVWTRTQSTPNSMVYVGGATVHRGSPLRNLIMDLLVTHWNSPTNIVARDHSLRPLWGQVFDVHTDFRREFIFGLQDRKLFPSHAYHVGDGNTQTSKRFSGIQYPTHNPGGNAGDNANSRQPDDLSINPESSAQMSAHPHIRGSSKAASNGIPETPRGIAFPPSKKRPASNSPTDKNKGSKVSKPDLVGEEDRNMNLD